MNTARKTQAQVENLCPGCGVTGGRCATCPMFTVFWTNHGYASSEKFNTPAEALAYGKSKCMEFSVSKGSDVILAWSPIGGTRTYGQTYRVA
jgi:hypothetical protein